MTFLISNLFFWSKRLLVGSILFFAIVTLFVRLSLPLIESYKTHLADWLSHHLNTPVSIQQLQADLQGFSLVVDLQGLSLGPADQAFALQRASLTLGMRGLRLHLDRLQLTLIRHTHGEFELLGLPEFQQSGGSLGWPPITLVFRDTSLIWHDQQYSAAPLALNAVQLVLRASNDKVRLQGQFENQLGKLAFVANMQSDFSQGESYLSWHNLPFASVAQPYLPEIYPLGNGSFDTEMWQQWKEGVPVLTKAKVAFNDVQLAENQPAFDWQAKLDFALQAGGAWRLNLADVLLNDQADSIGSIAVQNSAFGELELAVDYLEIEPILNVVRNYPGLLDFHAELSGLRPSGRLQNVQAKWHLADAVSEADWLFNAQFGDLAIQAWDKFPAIHGVHGRLAMQPTKASLALQVDEQLLSYAELFDRPIPIKQLSTVLYAIADMPESWRIQTEQLTLNTADFSSRGAFRLRLTQGQVPNLDAQLAIASIQAKQLKHYVPPKLVEPELTAWLDTAFPQGKLEPVKMLLSGPLDTFPYDETRNGVFEVIGDVRNFQLQYQKGWPILNVDEGLVHVYQNSLDAKLTAGRLYQNQVEGQAHIQSLDPTSALLASGKAKGPLQDILRLLKEDALKADFGQITDFMHIKGEGGTELMLSVPLVVGRSELSVQGKMQFDRNDLRLNPLGLTAKGIHGELRLDQTQLYAQNLKANVLGTPIQVNIQPKSGNNQIKVVGRFKPELVKQVKPDMPLSFLRGDAQANLTLTLPGLRNRGGKMATTLSVQSDLKGLQIDLPKPLGKSAQAKQDLRLDIMLSDSKVPIQLTYADALRAAIAQNGQRADLRYQTGKPTLPEQGYRLDAKFNALDLAAWQDFVQSLPRGQSVSQLPWQAQLMADQMDYQGLHLTNVVWSAERDAQHLRGHMRSDQLVGSVFYPQKDSGRLSLHLDKAHIVWKKSEGKKPLPKAFGPDPRALPAMRLICDDLNVNQMPLGQVVLDSRKVPQGLHIDKLIVAGEHLSLNAQGDWVMLDERPATQLQGKFHTDDLGNFLDSMGFKRSVQDAEINLVFDVNWPGHPLQVRKETIAGEGNLQVGAGRLSELEPGLVKVLGLLNLDVLSRRLQLDFADLLEKGYSFDQIKGDFSLEKGNANTRNLQVLGPTSHIQMGGRIGFVERDFDSLVYVTPELDGTLLLAGVLAGGPVVGLGALLVQQLLDEEVNDFSRFEYKVDGSWDEPILTPLEAGALSGLVNTISGEASQDKTLQQETMIEAETDKQSFLQRLLEGIEPSGGDQEFLDDPQFEAVD